MEIYIANLYTMHSVHTHSAIVFVQTIFFKGIFHTNYKIRLWFPCPVSSPWTRYDRNPCFGLVSLAVLALFSNAGIANRKCSILLPGRLVTINVNMWDLYYKA